jgi:DEAD/DEAH box helicase domain-containing protein
VDTTGETEVIGEVDFPSALATVHPKAIYLHQGQQYHVDRLDFDERKAYVRRVDADYYTDAIRYTQVRVLESAAEARLAGVDSGADLNATRSHGDVQVRSQVVGFKKIKFFTNENVGSGKLELPENEMHTTAFWLTLERALVESLPFPIRERQNGMFGLLYALESVAALLLMCDKRDLGTAIGEKSPAPGREREPGEDEAEAGEFAPRAPVAAAAADVVSGDRSDLALSAMADTEFFEPNLFLYDSYPGGIGFSEPLFRACDLLLARTRALIESCECEAGCPSCVGPAGERGEKAK